MMRMEPGERVHLDELRLTMRVATQIDASRIATVERAPRIERDRLRSRHDRVVGRHVPVLDQSLAVLFIGVRIHIRFGLLEQYDLERAKRFRMIAAAEQADSELTPGKESFDERSLFVPFDQLHAERHEARTVPHD